MSVNLEINGIVYAYPTTRDQNWGNVASQWANAVTTGMLQKAGGLFLLLAEVDFGSDYGLKSIYFKSRASDVAESGIFRLGNSEGIGWRNGDDDGDLLLNVDSNDVLNFNGTPVSAILSVSDTNSIDLTLSSNVLSAALNLSSASAAGGSTKVALSIESDGLLAQMTNSSIQAAISLTASRAVVTSGAGALAAATTTATEIGYVNGVTSSIQTQLNAKEPTVNLTASRAVVSSGGGALAAATTTATEIGYVNGVTSAIQTQLNAKLNLSGGTMSGAIAMGNSKITGLGTPTSSADAATKAYVDSAVSNPAIGALGVVQYSNGSGVLDGDASKLFLDTSNVRLGIGTNAPSRPLDVRFNTTGKFSASGIIAELDADDSPTQYILTRTNGSYGSPTQLLSGEHIGFLDFQSYTNAPATFTGARIYAQASENWTATRGTSIHFQATLTGAASISEFARLQSSAASSGLPQLAVGTSLTSIGTNSAFQVISPTQRTYVQNTSNSFVQERLDSLQRFLGRRLNGSFATPTGLLAFNYIAEYTAGSVDSSGNAFISTSISSRAEEDWTSSARGTRMEFISTLAGTSSAVEYMRLQSSASSGGIPQLTIGSVFTSLGSTYLLQTQTSTHQFGITNTSAMLLNRDDGTPTISLRRTNGSFGSPTQIVSGNSIGEINFDGYENTPALGTGAQIAGVATANWTSTSRPTGLRVSVSRPSDGSIVQSGQFATTSNSTPCLFLGNDNTEHTASLCLNIAHSGARSAALGNSGAMSDNSSVGWLGYEGTTFKSQFGVAKSTGNPTVGYIGLVDDGGNTNNLWCDDAASPSNLMISRTFSHVGSSSGTIVGTQSSDRRLKKDIEDSTLGLQEILQVRPVKFKYKADRRKKKEHLGFLAQEVQHIIPQAVYDTGEAIDESGKTQLAMVYVEIIPVLVNAIKELKTINDGLLARIEALEAEV